MNKTEDFHFFMNWFSSKNLRATCQLKGSLVSNQLRNLYLGGIEQKKEYINFKS